MNRADIKFCSECGRKLTIIEEVYAFDQINIWGICPKWGGLFKRQAHDYILLDKRTKEPKYNPYTGEKLGD